MTTLPSRVRSETEAYQILENDFSPRKRELLNLKMEIGSRRPSPVILKSAILLSYAHIEGATKAGIWVLMTRLNGSGLTWGGVKENFSYFEIDHRLARQVSTQFRRPVVCGDETTGFLRSIAREQIRFDVPGFISQIGVMNAPILRKIFATCGFALTQYEADLELLDDRLVARRHELAHGGLIPVDRLAADTAVDIAISLLSAMLIDFGNLLISQSYLERPVPAARIPSQ